MLGKRIDPRKIEQVIDNIQQRASTSVNLGNHFCRRGVERLILQNFYSTEDAMEGTALSKFDEQVESSVSTDLLSS